MAIEIVFLIYVVFVFFCMCVCFLEATLGKWTKEPDSIQLSLLFWMAKKNRECSHAGFWPSEYIHYVFIVPTAYGKRTIFIYSYSLEILPSTIRNRLTERRFVGDFPIVVGTIHIFKAIYNNVHWSFCSQEYPYHVDHGVGQTHCTILQKDPQFCHGDTKYFGPIICSDSMGNPTYWHPKFGGPWWFDMEEWLICTHSHSWTSTSCLNHTGLANLNGDMFQTTPLIHFYYSSYMFLSWIS